MHKHLWQIIIHLSPTAIQVVSHTFITKSCHEMSNTSYISNTSLSQCMASNYKCFNLNMENIPFLMQLNRKGVIYKCNYYVLHPGFINRATCVNAYCWIITCCLYQSLIEALFSLRTFSEVFQWDHNETYIWCCFLFHTE